MGIDVEFLSLIVGGIVNLLLFAYFIGVFTQKVKILQEQNKKLFQMFENVSAEIKSYNSANIELKAYINILLNKNK